MPGGDGGPQGVRAGRLLDLRSLIGEDSVLGVQEVPVVWIPACAGMTNWGMAYGGMQAGDLEEKNE